MNSWLKRGLLVGVLLTITASGASAQDSYTIRKHQGHYDATLVRGGMRTELSEFGTRQEAEAYGQKQGVRHLCGAPTKKGAACKRRVKAKNEKCWQHREVKK